MSRFTDTMQEIAALSTEERVGLAAASYMKLLPALRQIDERNHGLTLLCAIFGTAAGADGVLNAAESALIRAIVKAEGLELTHEDVTALVTASTRQDGYEMIRRLASILPAEEQSALATLVAVVSAIDGIVAPEELTYIESLIGL